MLYVIVKSPSKPYIVVHLFSIVLQCTQCIYYTVIQWYMQSWHTWWLTLGVQFKPCLRCIYSIAVGYSSNTFCYNIYTDSSLIHAVVLCESAQRYRALMVILQSHTAQNMILRCYPNVSAILWRRTKSCLLCFFNNPYISPF